MPIFRNNSQSPAPLTFQNVESIVRNFTKGGRKQLARNPISRAREAADDFLVGIGALTAITLLDRMLRSSDVEWDRFIDTLQKLIEAYKNEQRYGPHGRFGSQSGPESESDY